MQTDSSFRWDPKETSLLSKLGVESPVGKCEICKAVPCGSIQGSVHAVPTGTPVTLREEREAQSFGMSNDLGKRPRSSTSSSSISRLADVVQDYNSSNGYAASATSPRKGKEKVAYGDR